jgi:hypothetical protein
MNWWQRLRARGRLEEQLDAELKFHLERLVAEKVRAGVPEKEARRLARLEFGALEWVKEECRDARGAAWLETTARDIQFGWRTLWKSPGFGLAAICTLALGIGANTAMFSVVYAVLLKPLPYAEPERLVSVTCFVPELRARIPSMGLRARDFDAYRRSNSTLAGISALRSQDFSLTGEGDPERLYGARVSANFFSMLGAQPDCGRTFLPEEDQPGRDNVVVLSHELWTRRFGAAPDILNRSILLDGLRFARFTASPRATSPRSESPCAQDVCWRMRNRRQPPRSAQDWLAGSGLASRSSASKAGASNSTTRVRNQ